ncbi:endonuclease MutS2 [Pseudobacteroides cellulosolvens]|uniref:DNA mismatch repair protein MutS domain protein n=1 Tax=Pseudobacteroides cellulosolvens ATCC 35603 = DSM 2933 TaxID=398512 RepID=A0A0L6JUC5_9FIRM|nr:DNA mismatch repair protein MutS [Pseudobacteroides cellulosolvens]KNY29423.1 DNA mismatch repair protein MutS domain protein [Pseudobacteroides cellulosolvens ATCC 35603 = DSM 2933]
MNKKYYETLEFNKVLDILEECALSDKAKHRIKKLEPYMSESEVSRHLNETSEARLIMEHYGTPPLSCMEDLEKSLVLLGKGSMLMPEQLGNIAQFFTSCRRLKSYLKKAEASFTAVASYGNSIYDLSDIEDEINRIIRGSQVVDNASSVLADIRRKIANAETQVKSKLDSLLRNNKIWFSESFVSIRNGHYTLPVKKEYKNQVKGSVVDISQSGSTYFIEPSSVGKFQEEVGILRIEEENEVRRILYVLTALVEENLPYININIEAMETLDFIFAKAKLSIAMKASPLPVSIERKVEIKSGRHPLLKADTIVPLDFHIGGNYKGVIITGPNTGGKTVALKTIGLLSVMAQCGLHVPAEGGCFTMNNYVLCDIGDGQSITENLSTFSSHMTNIIQILKLANDQSLVLLDELGSGTDPAEGMGLAIAILEELAGKNCLFVATTHYPEIKDFAKSTPGLVNARMAFDLQSLLPLYKLEIGEAGESCALYIARRLGLPLRMIERASIAAYGSTVPMAYTEDSGSTVTPSKEIQQIKVPNKIVRKPDTKKTPDTLQSNTFNIGDSVMVYPQKMIGIVYQKANEKGDVGVQVKDKKLLINHKRLKLHVPASELYPENYDFSIIFDSVENRKKRHSLGRKHDPSIIIETWNEDGGQ